MGSVFARKRRNNERTKNAIAQNNHRPNRIEVRQGRHHEVRGQRAGPHGRRHPDRRASARCRTRNRRRSPRAHRRGVRPRIQRQDHACPADPRRSAGARRHRRVHRRRACARPRVRRQARCRHRRGSHRAARYRRAGARDLRHAREVRGHRLHRHRLRGRPRAARRDRGRDRRHHRGPAGSPNVTSFEEARRLALEIEHHLHLHQPASREDRRHVRQPRNDDRRPRPQVLLERAHRHPPYRLHQG